MATAIVPEDRRVTANNVTDIDIKQAREILEQICSTASSFNELLFDMQNVPGAHSLCCVAQNIGFLADLGLSKLKAGQIVGGAEAWMLSPAYHDTESTVEVSHE